MAFPENSDPRQRDPKGLPGRKNIESEETELVRNDPAERAVSGVGMDQIGESGDRDPLIGVGVDEASEARQAEAAAPEAASRSHDAEEDRVRPGDRKRGVE